MKTIATNPPNVPSSNPDLIKDSVPVKSVSQGKEIGDLIGGQGAPSLAAMELAEEEAHWRENHASQPFAQGHSYEDFGPAYRAGFEGYSRHGVAGRSFDETETELRERYESENGSPKIPWTVAKAASHAAWHRSARRKHTK